MPGSKTATFDKATRQDAHVVVDIWHNILWSKNRGVVFSELAKECTRRGIKVTFYHIAATDGSRLQISNPDPSYHDYEYHLVWDKVYEDIPISTLIVTLTRMVARSSADIIVLPGYHRIEYWIQLIVARLTKKKVLFFCDSTYYDKPKYWAKEVLKRVFFANCSGVFCLGQRNKEYMLRYGIPAEDIIVDCQAAALPHNYNKNVALEERRAAIRSSDTPTILYVGRLAPEKNLSMLLYAFAKLAREDVNCRLKLVGIGPDRNKLENIVNMLELSQRVFFLGGLSDKEVQQEYLSATCLVLPSYSEPWGLVVNEALSFGCPVLVSDHCGCVPELVEDGVTGFRFNPVDLDDIEQKLRRGLSVFSNNEDAAIRCIEAMQQYTPYAAAISMASGLENAVARLKRRG